MTWTLTLLRKRPRPITSQLKKLQCLINYLLYDAPWGAQRF